MAAKITKAIITRKKSRTAKEIGPMTPEIARLCRPRKTTQSTMKGITKVNSAISVPCAVAPLILSRKRDPMPARSIARTRATCSAIVPINSSTMPENRRNSPECGKASLARM